MEVTADLTCRCREGHTRKSHNHRTRGQRLGLLIEGFGASVFAKALSHAPHPQACLLTGSVLFLPHVADTVSFSMSEYIRGRIHMYCR